MLKNLLLSLFAFSLFYQNFALKYTGTGASCGQNSDCSLYTAKCLNQVCTPCTEDIDCSSLSSLFLFCNASIGMCFSKTPDPNELAPESIAVLIVLFVVYFSVVAFILVAWVINSRSNGILQSASSTKASSGEGFSNTDAEN